MKCGINDCDNKAETTVLVWPLQIDLCRDHYDQWRTGDELPQRFAEAALSGPSSSPGPEAST